MNNANIKREELPKSAPGGGNPGVMDQAKRAAGQIATEVTEQAKDKVNTTIDMQKEKAAGSIGGVADALRQTGRTLRERDTTVPAQYVDRAADQIERVGNYVRNRTIGQLVGDAEEFARREPAIFFGGAFALGLLAARFLKSSDPRAQGARTDRTPTISEARANSSTSAGTSMSASRPSAPRTGGSDGRQ